MIVISSFGDLHYDDKHRFDALVFIPGEKREVITVAYGQPSKLLMNMNELFQQHNAELARCSKIIEDVMRKSEDIKSGISTGEVPECLVSKFF